MAVLVSEYIEAVVMNIYKTCCLVVQTVFLVGMLPYKIISSYLFPSTPKTFSSVFITGASSGIGAELAKQYASKGVRLTLTARRVDKLSEVKRQCEALGAIVHTVAVDVTNKIAMREAVCEADDKQPLDLVIANAGVAATTLVQKNDKVLSDVSSAVTEVNVIGVCNTFGPALEKMQLRKRGQLVINASFTGVIGMSGDPLWFAYVPSKIWACTYGMGLRSILKLQNIGVTVLCPGLIKTELVADFEKVGHGYSKFYAADCGGAVKQMRDGIANDVGMVYVNGGILNNLVAGACGYNLIPSFLWNELAPLTNMSPPLLSPNNQ